MLTALARKLWKEVMISTKLDKSQLEPVFTSIENAGKPDLSMPKKEKIPVLFNFAVLKDETAEEIK